jgi:hypothetical protein
MTTAAAFLFVVALLAPAASSSPSPPPSPPVVDRVVRDGRLPESSGLAASLRHPGVLWTHNDSGHPAQLFAIGADGRTVATVRVAGAPATDWEAVAAYRGSDGRAMIAVADIGDNAAARASVSIVVLAEPELRSATVRPERVIRLTYPGGATDAEALLVDPDGRRAFVVSKGLLGCDLYEVPATAWTARSATAQAVLVDRAGVPLVLVTDGVMGPGGHPILRTYGELALLPPVDDSVTGGSLQPLATLRLPEQKQGEGLALRDPRTVLVGSEGIGQPVWRVPLPAEFTAVLGTPRPSATAPRTSSSPPTETSSDEPTRTSTGPDDEHGRSFPVLGGLAGAAVGAVLVLTVRARRRRSQ